MILVDVRVPSIGREYQFKLEETMTVDALIVEMADVICRKEHLLPKGDVEQLYLCDGKRGTILNRSLSLAEQGVRNADWLIFV